MNGLHYEVRRTSSDIEEIHATLTVLFVLEGSMTVKMQGDTIVMRERDLLLINPGISYELAGRGDLLYGEASYSMQIVADILNGKDLVLYADSVRDHLHSYEDLRNIFYELTALFADNVHKTNAAIDSLLLKLLDCLIEHYPQEESDSAHQEDSKNSQDARLRQIMQYIMSHLSTEINLTELADQMYVSVSTLSRIFHNSTGVYFTDYINRLRVSTAINLLRHSDQSLTQIAMNCGFSNSASFNRSFKKLIGSTPSAYREMIHAEMDQELSMRSLERQKIKEDLRNRGYLDSMQNITETDTIDTSLAAGQLYQKVWNQAINAGDIDQMTRANMQFHILYLQEHLHFRYIRLWNVFSKRMMITDRETPDVYNFDSIDLVLDFLVQHHLFPFLDLGRRPDMAVKDMLSNRDVIYLREEYLDFPDRVSWEHCLSSFYSHLLNRYGLEEVSHWIFELTRDSIYDSPLYGDPKYDFYDAWKFFYLCTKQIVPQALVGGISMAVNEQWDYLKTFYTRCTMEKCPPDFASFLLFPYGQLSSEEQKEGRHTLSQGMHQNEREISKMRQLMDESGLSDRLLFITEWNNSISNRNFLNDDVFRSAYLVSGIADLWGKVNLIAVMAASDWVSSYADTRGIVNGGIGLLTKDTIRKPAFYALEFLNQLGNHYLICNQHMIVTEQDNGDLYLLCFHFSWYTPHAGQSEDISIGECSHLFDDKRPMSLHLTLLNLKQAGSFYVKRQVLNQKNGSILNEWGKYQYENNLSRQDVKYLQEISIPTIYLERVHVDDDHTMQLEITLEPEEVSLLHIYHTEE